MSDANDIKKDLIEQIFLLNMKINEMEHYESSLRQVEEALRASEERYRRLMDDAPVGFCLVDTSGNIQYVNKQIEEVTGWSREELVGKNGLEIGVFPEATAKILKDRFLFRLAGGEPTPNSIEVPVNLKDGREIYIEMFTKIDPTSEGHISAQLVMLNITDKKRAEAALHRRLAYEKLLSRISANAVKAVDLNEFLQESIDAIGETVDVCRIYIFEHRHETDTMDNTIEWCAPGVSPQKDILQGVPSSACPWWTQTLRSGQNICFADIEEIPDEGCKEILRPQGILSILVVPLFVNGLYWGFMGFDDCKRYRVWLDEDVEILVSISRTISFVIERKEAEQRLQESEERYRILFESTSDVIYSLDTDLRITTLSPSVESYIGYKPEEFIGKFAYDIKIFHPEDLERGLKDISKIFKGEVINSHEYRLTAKDGTVKFAEISGAPIIRDGKVSGAICTARDITERKQAIQEREKLKELFDRAQRLEAIGTLAGGIAHDFNNLLMVIQGYTSLMLLELNDSHPNYERLSRIQDQVKSGAALTGQLLGFARGGRYDVKPADINNIIEKTSSMFARTRKDIIIHEKFIKPIWTVDADQTQMEQVFMNLYTNASHAMPVGGKLFVETKNVILDDKQADAFGIIPGKYVKIEVTDTGMGMDQLTKERIFEPFFTTKEMGRGTGLGLSMVYGIIKGHHGFIDVVSEPGQGTTFSLYLPATDKTVSNQDSNTPKIQRGSETILLVDDEEAVRDVSRDLLESLGYKVICAKGGQEALSFLVEKRGQIDMVMLDMIMPDMSGAETFDRLRKIDPEIKILLCSGYGIEGQALKILEKGCNGFIKKPYQLEKLCNKIREILKN